LPGCRVYLDVTSELPWPEPTGPGDPSWLEPYPDCLLDDLPDGPLGPDVRYGATESVSLAFLAALQCLPPGQRAVLILRDVLGFPAAEVAGMLDSTEPAVASALQQARVTLAGKLPGANRERPPLPHSATERKIAGEFARAFEHADVPAILPLLTGDVWLTMPPLPLEYQGRAAIGQFLSTVAFRDGRRYRLLPTHANRQPAFGCYLVDPQTLVLHASGLLVLTLSGERICALTRFLDNGLLVHFGFPRTLPGWPGRG
jgi:RNA polymerase sigma-70 factor, ECF subfamily